MLLYTRSDKDKISVCTKWWKILHTESSSQYSRLYMRCMEHGKEWM